MCVVNRNECTLCIPSSILVVMLLSLECCSDCFVTLSFFAYRFCIILDSVNDILCFIKVINANCIVYYCYHIVLSERCDTKVVYPIVVSKYSSIVPSMGMIEMWYF